MASPLFRARLRLFPVAVRLMAAITLGLATAATISDAWYAAGLAVVGLVALIRLPRRTRLVECAFALALTPAISPQLFWPCVISTAVCCVLVLLAPEDHVEHLNGLDRLFISTDYSGVFDIHLWFDTRGKVDVTAVRQATNELLQQIPLARSFVREAFWGAERFCATPTGFDDTDVVTVHAATVTEAAAPIFNRAMAIDRKPPFAIDVFEADGATTLMFTFHHTFVDGGGALYFLDLFAERYDRAQGARGQADLPLPPATRRLRDFFADRPFKWKVDLVKRVVGKRIPAGTRYAALHDQQHDRGEIKLIHLDIDERRYATYQRQARRTGCSTNTFILACALTASNRWRRARGLADEPVRALVAADVRQNLGIERSLQNWVSRIPVVISDAGSELQPMVDALNDGVGRAKQGAAIEQTLFLAVNAAVYPTQVAKRSFAKRAADENSHALTIGSTTIRWDPRGTLGTSTLGIERMNALGPVSRVPGIVLFTAGTRTSMSMNVGYHNAVLSDDGARDFVALFEKELERACTQETALAEHA